MKWAAILVTLLGASLPGLARAQEPSDWSGAPAAAALTALGPKKPPEPAPEEVPRGFSVKVWGGPAYRQIYSIPIVLGDVGVALGAQFPHHLAAYGGVDLLIGKTQYGLPTTQIQIMGNVEARYGRFRFGAGYGLTYFAIARVTNGPLFYSFGLGLTALTSLDLVRTEEGRALYLGGSLGGDVLLAGQHSPTGAGTLSVSWIWGPSLALGVRY